MVDGPIPWEPGTATHFRTNSQSVLRILHRKKETVRNPALIMGLCRDRAGFPHGR
jgi:hypothetical protein